LPLRAGAVLLVPEVQVRGALVRGVRQVSRPRPAAGGALGVVAAAAPSVAPSVAAGVVVPGAVAAAPGAVVAGVVVAGVVRMSRR
jgi:hypothetical protein